MKPRQRMKQSQVPVGHFFETGKGDIFFKTDPKHVVWICNPSRSDVIRLDSAPVVDLDVQILSLPKVRARLKP